MAGQRILIKSELYICDATGSINDDISDLVVAGSIEWNADRSATQGGTPLAGSVTIRHPGRVRPVADFLMPVITLTYQPSGEVVSQRLGVFGTSLPEEEHWRQEGQGTFELNDLTTMLRDSAFEDPYSVPSGTNFGTAMRTIIEQAGITRHNVRTTDRTTGYDRTFLPGTTRLEALNRLADAIGWYHPYMDLDGRITTLPFRKFDRIEPSATYTAADPIGSIRIVPTATGIGNVAIVIKDNPSEAPVVVKKINDLPDSPISIPSLGGRRILIGGEPRRLTDVEDEAAATDIAQQMIDDSASYYRVVQMRVLPDPRQGIYRTVDLKDMQLGDVDLTGRYHLRTWKLGFTAADAAVDLELNATQATKLTSGEAT